MLGVVVDCKVVVGEVEEGEKEGDNDKEDIGLKGGVVIGCDEEDLYDEECE